MENRVFPQVFGKHLLENVCDHGFNASWSNVDQ